MPQLKLSLVIALITCAFILLTNALAFIFVFNNASKSSDIAINILADETILETRQALEQIFNKSTESVSVVQNASRRLGSPFSASAESKRIVNQSNNNIMNQWLNVLWNAAQLLPPQSGLNIRMAEDS